MNKILIKNILFFSILFLFLSVSLESLQAEDVLQHPEIVKVQEFNPRKGFFLSWGPLFGGEVRVLEQFVAGAELRFGVGITDRTLLYSESVFIYTNHQQLDYFTFLEQVKVQHFVYNELYFNFGVGIAVGDIAPVSAPTTSATKIGVSSSVQLGYEFRMTKKFAVSPEVGLYYHHLGESQDFISPMVDLNLSWYF